jgi:2-desacetyl-2-hydroxyethyl bacteriochlorophyllide A dehydrogenase
MDNLMKAIRITAPQTIELQELPVPVPGADQVLVEVDSVGVCRTDVEIYVNDLYIYHSGLAKLPITPGHEWAGWVVEVGRDVTRVRPGDAVTGETAIGCLNCRYCLSGRPNVCPQRKETGVLHWDGAYADYVLMPERSLHRVGEMPLEWAAFTEPTAVALWATTLAEVRGGDRVLVLGAGPIGLLCLQAALCWGARSVSVVARHPRKLALAKELGADHALNAREVDLREAAPEITQGEGFDVILEAAGALDLLTLCPLLLAPLGRLLITGNFGSAKSKFEPGRMVERELQIRASVGGGTCYPQALAMIEKERIRVAPLITDRQPLSAALETLPRMAEGDHEATKILLKPGAER